MWKDANMIPFNKEVNKMLLILIFNNTACKIKTMEKHTLKI